MKPPLLGHAIFDLDGTLVDSAPLCAELLNSMLADHGAEFRLTDDQTRPFITRGGPAMVGGLLGSHCGDPAAALDDFRSRYARAKTPIGSLYPEVFKGLARLKAEGAVLALCSNKPTRLCEKVLNDLNLRDLFSAVVGAEPGVPLKPDPTSFHLALERSGGSLDRCCYIGDSEVDYDVAIRVNVPYVMVTHGYGDYRRAWSGAHIARDFTAAAALVVDVLQARLRTSRQVLAS